MHNYLLAAFCIKPWTRLAQHFMRARHDTASTITLLQKQGENGYRMHNVNVLWKIGIAELKVHGYMETFMPLEIEKATLSNS